MVVGGVVGAWAGYWLGHALGVSTGAEWPWRVGGGAGAIVLSVGMAVLGVLVVGAAIALPPYLRQRRLIATGDVTGAEVLQRWSLGLRIDGPHAHHCLYGFVVRMRMPDGAVQEAHATQWMTDLEFDRVLVGCTVVAHVDPDHPDRVVVEAPAPPGPAVEAR